MTRNEFRLAITWPDGHSYGKHFRRADAAKRARLAYEADGAGVTVEVWSHAGEDYVRGWYRNAARTRLAQEAVAAEHSVDVMGV